MQSKEIGIQMHEELVKVTNELYTVSIISLNLSLPRFLSVFFSLSLSLWMDLSAAMPYDYTMVTQTLATNKNILAVRQVWEERSRSINKVYINGGKNK